MNRQFYHMGFLLVLPLLAATGCSVSFPQVDTLRAQLGADNQGSLTVPKDAIWLASFADEGQLLAAYQREGFILFANADSNGRVEFDGWLIRKVSGFSLSESGVIDIVSGGNAGPRTVATVDASVSVFCGDWLWYPEEGLSGVWQQSCDAFEPNVIRLNEKGAIVVIDQVVSPSGERLMLQRYDYTSQ